MYNFDIEYRIWIFYLIIAFDLNGCNFECNVVMREIFDP